MAKKRNVASRSPDGAMSKPVKVPEDPYDIKFFGDGDGAVIYRKDVACLCPLCGAALTRNYCTECDWRPLDYVIEGALGE